ncbi:hypothetical protein MA16_Dca027219 [Dendrobium catenatum]|uniref:Uncharacterized protein n=1 Tax=Dendrobium catenatum TaxID=906689 RepID=A0A2I0WXY1_9ASPA|nr:hypothetical protein MA16_Dca027219 [Dendrobium catenatum]
MLGTERYMLGTEQYILDTKQYMLGIELYMLGTEWYMLGTERYMLGTERYMLSTDVEITYQDCAELLQLSTTGDKLHLIVSNHDFNWSTTNHFQRQTNSPFHVGEASSLVKDAGTIQHILRTSIIPKVGDRIHITPLLSLTTFYIIAHRDFNATDLIFRYINNLTIIHDSGHKKKPNLALGHIISYVLETKYNLQYPADLNHRPPCYSNRSFNVLHSTRLHPGDGEPQGAEEEKAPAPIPDPVPLRQHSQFDQLVERFDHWETCFDAYVVAQEQQYSEDIARYEQHRTADLAHFNSYITHQKQQQHDQDIVWFNAKFTMLASYFQQAPKPPPLSDDQDPSFF